MASILLRVPVAAEAEAVHKCLATGPGVSGWWSERIEGSGAEGSTIKVSFPDAPMTFDFEVVEVAPERVAWRCIAGPPEWGDTDVSFDIQPGDEGASVLFTHGGWTTTEESFPFIAYSWAQILPRLKKLAESGERDPFFNF
jgi:hypothetical protein